MSGRAPPQLLTRRAWLARWVVANGLAEMIGLGLGALAASQLQALLQTRGVLLAVLVSSTVFAVIEGTAVGVAQHRVLADLAPRMPLGRWWFATVVGGWVAWVGVSAVFATMPATAGPSQAEPPLLLQLAVMGVAGLAAGPILGVPQAVALRRVHPRPWSWIGANALAWAVGLPMVQLVAGGIDVSGSVLVALGATALFATGAVVGAIHGPFLHRLLADPEPRSVGTPVRSFP